MAFERLGTKFYIQYKEHKKLLENNISKARYGFLLSGFLLIASTFYAHKQSIKIATWPQVNGHLHYSYTLNRSTPSRGVNGKDVAIIRYSYKVNGKIYAGSRLMALDFIFTPKKEIDNLKRGVNAVYFNPIKPSESFLSKKHPTTAIMILVLVGLLMIFIGAILPIILRSMYNGNKP